MLLYCAGGGHGRAVGPGMASPSGVCHGSLVQVSVVEVKLLRVCVFGKRYDHCAFLVMLIPYNVNIYYYLIIYIACNAQHSSLAYTLASKCACMALRALLCHFCALQAPCFRSEAMHAGWG